MMAFLPVINFFFFYLYGKSLTRLGPRRTSFWASILSSLGIFLTLGLIHLEFHLARGFLFLFREVYIVILVEQCWSLMDSLIDEDESKRVNYFFTAFASVGAILAGLGVGKFAVSLGTFNLPMITAALLLPSAFLMNFTYRRNQEHLDAKNAFSSDELSLELSKEKESFKKTLGLGYFKRYPVLGYLTGMVLVSQLLATILGLMFQEKLHLNFQGQPDIQTAYSGNFYALLNAASLVFQLVIGPFLLARFSAATTFILIPILNLVAACFSVWSGSMAAVSFAFLLFKAMDYSIFRATKETIFIAYPFDVRYRTKGMIDVVGYRLSKGLGSAGFAFVGFVHTLSLSLYGATAIGCAVIWSMLIPGFKKSFTDEKKAGLR